MASVRALRLSKISRQEARNLANQFRYIAFFHTHMYAPQSARTLHRPKPSSTRVFRFYTQAAIFNMWQEHVAQNNFCGFLLLGYCCR